MVLDQDQRLAELNRLASDVCNLRRERSAARRINPSDGEKRTLREIEERLRSAEKEMTDYARAHGFRVTIELVGKPYTYENGCVDSQYDAKIINGSRAIV